jgi:hypothetical protein
MGIKVIVKDEKLKEFQGKVKELAKPRLLTEAELYPDEFMREYTDFQSFRAMVEASGIKSIEAVGDEEFSKFVASHSRFKSWREMSGKAGIEYGKRQLGL